MKLGISVTLKVCIGEGSVSLEGVTPSGGIRVSSSLSVFRRHRLPLPRGKCVWLSHLRSSTVGCVEGIRQVGVVEAREGL